MSASAPASTPTPARATVPRVCEHCGADRVVLLTMKPGISGPHWYLCRACWLDGATPWKLGKIAAEYREDLVVTETTTGVVTTPTAEYPYELTERRPKDMPKESKGKGRGKKRA